MCNVFEIKKYVQPIFCIAFLSRCIAFLSRSSILKVKKMCIMICPRVTFQRIVTQEFIHYLLYSVRIFVLDILVQIDCSAPPFCSHTWDISCMLDFAAMPFAEHARLCALQNSLLDCAVCSHLIDCAVSSHLVRACVMTGGYTQVFWSVNKGLHVWGEICCSIIAYFLSCSLGFFFQLLQL